MKKNIAQMYRLLMSSVVILMLVLTQFPVVSLAFDIKKVSYSRISITRIKPESNFPAKSNIHALVAFSNSAPISISDRNNNAVGGTVGISSPYPSNIPVLGLSGTVSDINVTLTGFNAPRPRDIDIVLVAPSGQALTLMADTGGLISTSPGVNITFDDAASPFLPETTAISSGTYKPTDYVFSATDRDDFPPPGPSSVNDPAPTGAATLASVFNGVTPNGNWSLYAIDDSLGGGNSMITGGWSIDITTAGAVAATTTSISSNLNPALTSQTITFTSTTISGGSPVTAGTVSFTNNGSAIAGCTNVTVNGSGQATCMTMLAEGTRTITATYNGTATLGMSNGSLTQVVNSPTVVMGAQFCNNGGITIPDPGAATPYPSNITVSGLVGTISNVTVQLNDLSAPRPSNLNFLLVGAGGQALQIISDVGDAVTPAVNVDLTLDDNAAMLLPQNTAIASGTFRPTDYTNDSDTYPAPAPGTYNQPAPTGSSTFASVYGSTNPNGNWALYAFDDGIGGGASTVGSYCLNFTLNKFTTTTTVISSMNPSPSGQSVTFTANVSTTGTPVGMVEFFDGATSLGTGTLNGSGQATLTTSTLASGMRSITAQYLGADVGAGGGGFTGSTSSVLSQNILVPTAASVIIGGRIITPSGEGIPRAIVMLTDGRGNMRFAITDALGFYHFTEVQVGEGYLVNVRVKNKRFARFTPQFIVINEELNNLNFTSIE